MRFLLLLLGLIAPALNAQQMDWPAWRGPNHDGISLDAGWSSVGASEPLWRASIGTGYSNVSILDGRLVAMGYDEEASEDVVVCMDAATGELHWTHRYAAEPLANYHGGGTLSTPTLHAGKVYTVNRYGVAYCLSLEDGSVWWTRDYTAEFELKPSFHGFSASPLIQGEDVVYSLGGVLLSASIVDGDVIWRNASLGDGGYGNPVPFDFRGERCLACFAGPGLRINRLLDGELLQRFDWKGSAGGINSMTPIVTEGRVFISCAYSKGAALVKLGEGEESELIWASRRFRNKVGDCVLEEGFIYGFDEGMLKCIDLEGKQQWAVRGMGMGTLSLSDGRLIVLTSDGELVVAKASPDAYEELSRTQALEGGVYWTAPVMVGSRLYLRNSLGDLICRDHRAESTSVLADVSSESAVGVVVPTAEALFASHLEARGGAEKLGKRKSLRLMGKIELLGVGITESDLEVYSMAPNRYLRRVQTEFGIQDDCYDGKLGWILDPAFGDRLLEGDELREIGSAYRFHLDMEGTGAFAEIVSRKAGSFEGTACWVLTGRTKEGSLRSLYFDRSTGLMRGREGETEARVEYADWKAFSGILLPTRVTYARAETGVEECQVIHSATWDGVEEGIFEANPKVKLLLRTPEEIEQQNRAIEATYSPQLGYYKADFKPFDGAILQIRADDGRLALIGTRGPMHLVEADEEDTFTLVIAPSVRLVFDSPVDGVCPGLSLTNSGSTDHAPRVEAPEPGDGGD